MNISVFDPLWPVWDIIRNIENKSHSQLCTIDTWDYVTKDLIDVKTYSELSSGTLKIGDRWDESITYFSSNEFELNESFNKKYNLDSKPLYFLFDSPGEGEVFINGKAMGSLDTEHSYVLLTDSSKNFGMYKIEIEMTKHIHDAAKKYRSENIAYGHHVLNNAGIFTIDEDILKFAYLCYYLLDIVRTLDAKLENDLKIINLLTDVLKKNLYPMSYDRDTMLKTKAQILEDIKPIKHVKDYGTANYTGHSHLDLVFKWTWKETVRKIERTLSNTNTILRQYHSSIYTQSQMQIFDTLKKEYPDLFEECKELVKNNQIEVMGSTWCEFDANVTSIESVIRQILLGKAFSKENFDIESNVLFLPDCFGFSAALPQVFHKTGYKYFTTTKLYWNDTNEFPYNVFDWEGIDGSKISSVLLSGGYSSGMNFGSIHGNQWNLRQKEIKCLPMMYGASDGGGGISTEMVLKKEAMKEADILVKIKDSTLLETLDEMTACVHEKPVYTGELYLEKHRGTYTSQARIKKNNRTAEQALYNAETLLTCLFVNGEDYPTEVLQEHWKTLCFNQFHDILPGSCIKEAKLDNWAQMSQLENSISDLLNTKLRADSDSDNLVLFNQLPFERTVRYEFPLDDNMEYLLFDDDKPISSTLYYDYNNQLIQCFETTIKGLSTKNITYKLVDSDFINQVIDYDITAPFTFKNDNYEVVFDNRDGHFISIKRESKILIENSNVITAFYDKGGYFNAWDISNNYADFPIEAKLSKASKINENAVRLELHFLDSFIVQDITFDKIIKFKTTTNFKNDELLLKTFFHTETDSKVGYYDLSAGYIARSSAAADIEQSTKYEVPLHKWMANDIQSGVAILNDCKYGGNIVDGTLNLTLLKTGVFPDPTQDKEETEFTYYLYFFENGLSDVNQKALCVNATQNLFKAPRLELNSIFNIDNPNIFIQAIKKCEKDDGIIIRVVNYSNENQIFSIDSSIKFKKIAEVTPIENYINDLSGLSNLVLSKFELKTFKLY